jgi:hypothetical protein
LKAFLSNQDYNSVLEKATSVAGIGEMSWKYEYMHQDIIMEPPLRADNKLLLVD